MKKNIDVKQIFKKPGLYIALFLLIPIGFLSYQIIRFDILPTMLFVLVLLGLLCIYAITAILLIRKSGKVQKAIGIILAICITIVSCFGGSVMQKVYDTLDNVTQQNEMKSIVKIYQLKASPIVTKKTKDPAVLKGHSIGYVVNQDQALRCLTDLGKKNINVQQEEYSTSADMIEALKSQKIDFLVLDTAYLSLLEENEQYKNIEDELDCVFTYTYARKNANTISDIDVTKDTFSILISGIDSREGLTSYSNSDVNLILVVNPTSKKVLMLNTPRDFYVETACDPALGCAAGKLDKLTNVAYHGIGTTEATLEKLYGIEINYNIKVSFETLSGLVDDLGGITINNPIELNTQNVPGFYFPVGSQNIKGDQALAYARERYSYGDGDRQRGKNQMIVLEGIMKKAMSPAILKNFINIMDSLSKTFETNMPIDKMTSLIKMQLNEGGAWSFYNYSANGTGGMDYAYENGTNAYVMYPDVETVNNAKEDIQLIKDGKAPTHVNE